jgi:hypothetical protein
LSNNEWTLKERLSKQKISEKVSEKIEENSISVAIPLLEKYTTSSGKDFR